MEKPFVVYKIHYCTWIYKTNYDRKPSRNNYSIVGINFLFHINICEAFAWHTVMQNIYIQLVQRKEFVNSKSLGFWHKTFQTERHLFSNPHISPHVNA